MSKGKKIALGILIFCGFNLFLLGMYGYLSARKERNNGMKAYKEMIQYVKENSGDIIEVSSYILDHRKEIKNTKDLYVMELRSSLTEEQKEKLMMLLVF